MRSQKKWEHFFRFAGGLNGDSAFFLCKLKIPGSGAKHPELRLIYISIAAENSLAS
jgi:hypothetical protein